MSLTARACLCATVLIAASFAPRARAADTGGKIAGVEAGVTITLRENASIEKDFVLLKDVADLSGNVARRLRLASLDLGRAPAPGQAGYVDQSDVLAALRKQALDPESIELAGATRTRVVGAAQRIEPEELGRAAQEGIEAHYSDRDDLEVQVETTSLPKSLLVRPGPVKLRVDIPAGRMLYGRRVVRVRVLAGDMELDQAHVGVRVRIFQQAPVAANRIETDKVIEAADIAVESLEIRNGMFEGGLAMKDIVGKRARFTIAPGRPITEKLIEEAPVIHRGDRVIVVVQRGGLMVKTAALAREDAVRGAGVRLKLVDSGAEVYARCTGPGQASL